MKQTPFVRHCGLKQDRFYQDRLGTNAGQVEEKRSFSCLQVSNAVVVKELRIIGAKSAFFPEPFCTHNDRFVKTGSGQMET